MYYRYSHAIFLQHGALVSDNSYLFSVYTQKVLFKKRQSYLKASSSVSERLLTLEKAQSFWKDFF